MEEKVDTSNLYVIYVQEVGKDNDDNFVYEFLVSEDPDSVWGDNWNEKPAGNELNLKPSDDYYDYVKELRSNIKLDLGQNNLCVSFMDIKDNIMSLAYENLDDAEEYPDGRLIFHYGEPLSSVEEKLAKRDLFMKYV